MNRKGFTSTELRSGNRAQEQGLRLREDEGQVLMQVALLLPLLLLMIGLVFDGGMMYVQYRRAEIAALTAAQAASHAVDVEYFHQTNQIRLDADQAAAIAADYAYRNSGGHVAAVGISVRPNQVMVEVRGQVPTLFMRAFGIGSVPIRAWGVAYPAYGIEQEGQ